MSDQQPEPQNTSSPAPPPPPGQHVTVIDRITAFEEHAASLEQRISQLTGLHNQFVTMILRELGL